MGKDEPPDSDIGSYDLLNKFEKELAQLHFMQLVDSITNDDHQRLAVYAIRRVLRKEGMSEGAFLAAANDKGYGWTAEKNARRVQLIKSKPLSDSDTKELELLTEHLRYSQEELHDQLDADLDLIIASSPAVKRAKQTS